MDPVSSVRIDKWLWAARFFRTRAQAARACELGRIEVGGRESKASREVRAGDKLKIRNESGEFQVEVLAVSALRGPAATAQALYRESEASREQRAKLAAERNAMMAFDGFTDAKPSKRNRREMNRLRGR